MQEDYFKAEFFYKKALTIREQHFGIDDPRTAYIYFKLAQLYYSQDRFEEAELLYQKALNIYKRTLRSEHPALATTLKQYAILLQTKNNGA